MTDREIIRHIDEGAVFYLDFFAAGPHMEKTDMGYYRFMKPVGGEKGVRFVYDVRLDGLSENEQLEKIAEIKALKMPVWWSLQSSDELYFRIYGKTKQKSAEPADGDDLYIGILSADGIPKVCPREKVSIKKVASADEFALWTQCVNGWLHSGYPYIHPQNHYGACESGVISCYVCFEGETPTAVCAVFDNGGVCSLEFVATHPDYRRRKFASFLCFYAMREAFSRGADIITLRAGNPGTQQLYTSLGFGLYNHAI